MWLLSIGLGIFAPMGGLSNQFATGNELKISCQANFSPIVVGVRVITFKRDKLNVNIFEFTGEKKFCLFNRIYPSIGVGGYYATKSLNNGFENEFDLCLDFGFSVSYPITETLIFYPEISYLTVPQGISLGLSLGINL